MKRVYNCREKRDENGVYYAVVKPFPYAKTFFVGGLAILILNYFKKNLKNGI